MRNRPTARVIAAAAIALLAAATPRQGDAQSMAPYVPIAPHEAWRTIETPRFLVHYPATLDAWARDAAEHLEGELDAVRRLVGYAPPGRITVLVADPYNDANGSAYPFLRAPAVFLWPVPADPRSGFGTTSRWTALLTVHELAHLAHLTRPSRNPLRGTLAALLPTNVGAIAPKTPRWVWEGYATYVEGVLTGGRPFSAWRPAFLRQWAIEGRLPTYAQVSGAEGFAGGSFAYLAGSAYLEWLVAQRGDSSLPRLWRRLTARTPRGFDAAFAGVFPGTPGELYARWSAQVTAEAVAAERALRDAGLSEGALVQRLRSATGDPAVTRDGERVALVVRTPGRASRIVVWRTGAEPRDTSARARSRAQAVARERARSRSRDPEDVPAVPYLPAPKRELATLPARAGRAFRAPRWLPDGQRMVVERDEPLPDGRLRPDLWIWDTRSNALRRVTRGAAVRDADPSPDGATALATRCTRGWCDVVRVDLSTGVATTVVEGSPTRTYARPRWSPDGRRFAVAALVDGRWRVLVGASDAGAPLAPVGPDDGAARYDPAFLPDGAALVVTSERGGVPNVERVDLATGVAAPLTRVTGAAFAPEPIGAQRAVYFLALRSTGFDLRRVAIDSVPRALAATPATPGAGSLVADSTLGTPRVAVGGGASSAAAAVVERRATRDELPPSAAPAPPRAYGLGTPHFALLPAGAWTPDGNSAMAVIAGSDAVGRLTWVLAGAGGAPATWRGASLSLALRAVAPVIDAQAFAADQRFAAAGEVRYRGALLSVTPRATLGAGALSARIGGSLGRLAAPGADDAADRLRAIAFAEARAATTLGRGDALLSLGGGASASTGRGGGAPFTRWLASASVSARTPLAAARGSFALGGVSARATPFERFAIGGAEPALIDASLLGQRIAMPALATASLVGRRVAVARVGLGDGLVEPYAWAARTPDVSERWLRVIGAETSWATGPVPFARAPGARAVAGVGYPLDGPTRRRLQIYFSIAARP